MVVDVALELTELTFAAALDEATVVEAAVVVFPAGLVVLVLPAVTALLLVNLSFGVLTRAAPQLNIFSLGFPMTLMFGVLIMWVSSAGWLPQFDALSREFFALLNSSFR